MSDQSKKDIQPKENRIPLNEERGNVQKSYTTSHLEDKLSGGGNNGGSGGNTNKDKNSG